MSTHVMIEYKTKPGRADELISRLGRVLPDALKHEGCGGVWVRMNQDDPTNVISLSQWTTRGHYEMYLAWRTERGDRESFEEMLTEPMAVRYFDEIDFAQRQ
ncbi:MAG: antibiotic biosynthesis monooxygenase [Thaumarchaeota archaeon]|nr:antibiotic biosynthesis monooxygenase [Nitrososphaerota archaeon]